MGSPSYMSPEQLKSTKEVDLRTDVWSLGAVLYEAMTGQPAFRGDSVPQVCAMIASEDPLPPSRLRAGVVPEVEQAILACLEKDPDRRIALVDLATVFAHFAPDRAKPSSRASSPPSACLRLARGRRRARGCRFCLSPRWTAGSYRRVEAFARRNVLRHFACWPAAFSGSRCTPGGARSDPLRTISDECRHVGGERHRPPGQVVVAGRPGATTSLRGIRMPDAGAEQDLDAESASVAPAPRPSPGASTRPSSPKPHPTKPHHPGKIIRRHH